MLVKFFFISNYEYLVKSSKTLGFDTKHFVFERNKKIHVVCGVKQAVYSIAQPKRVKSLNSVIFVSHPYIFKKKSSSSAL